ncbi:MAG: S8 family serine peptidase [Candidatus Bathyarchaeia archaeon]
MRKTTTLIVMFLPVLLSAMLISGLKAQPPGKVPVIVGFKEKPDPDLIRSHGGDIKCEYKLIPAVVCSLPQQAIDSLKKNPKIKYIEPDIEVYIIQETLPWGVERIDAEIVHGYNKGAGIKVAILDTGIDYTHPDLNDNYKGGYDFVNNDADPKDDHGHGTHCAGIVAAEDNEIGVIGVAPEAHLYAVKVLNSAGSGYLSNVISGIQWCVNNNIQVVSMSLGTSTYSQSLKDACDNAYKKGLVLVAAAGNNGDGNPNTNEYSYPAAYDSVIAVGATASNDVAPYWSNSGPYLELAAPGVSIYSTLPTYSVTLTRTYGYNYGTLSGTSMACPHVAGTAALVIASNPALTNIDVRTRLQTTADDLGTNSWDTTYGYGLIDADEAATKTDVHDVAVTAIDAPSWVAKGDTAIIKITVKNEGTAPETLKLNLTDITSNVNIGSASFTLTAGASTTQTFNWDTTSASVGTHTLKAEASVLEGETDTTDNSKITTIEVITEIKETYSPQGVYITKGTLSLGDHTSLFNDDSVYLGVKSARVGFTQVIDWYAYVKINENPSKITNLTITYDGKYSVSRTQRLYIYDFTSNSWRQIDSRTIGTSDTKITWSTTSPASYISTNGEIRLRVYTSAISSFVCYADFASYTIKT